MSKKAAKRGGFTLVEVLIVVVIMAILAATIIPQFSNSSQDAKLNTTKFNLHTLRSQIELYKSQHDGKLPTAGMAELTAKTNALGTVGTTTLFIYGPYLQTLPTNSFTGTNSVTSAATTPSVGGGTGGWMYNTATGEVKIDTTDATIYAN